MDVVQSRSTSVVWHDWLVVLCLLLPALKDQSAWHGGTSDWYVPCLHLDSWGHPRCNTRQTHVKTGLKNPGQLVAQ